MPTLDVTDISPTSFSISLETTDSLEKSVQPYFPCTPDNDQGIILLRVDHPLQGQRLWTYHLYANNCSASIISDNMTLSELANCCQVPHINFLWANTIQHQQL